MFGLKARTSTAKLLALQALDERVLITDSSLKVVYANPAMLAFLRTVEADLRETTPQFSLNALLGSNLDVIRKGPTHQRATLSQLTQPHRSTLKIGSHQIEECLSPLGKPGKPTSFLLVWTESNQVAFDSAQQIAAFNHSHAMIEFKPDGTVINANENFLKLMGYGLSEVQGRLHKIFVLPAERESHDYAEFWKRLAQGEDFAASFKRVTKEGKVVTIQGAYNPIKDKDGKVVKVVKLATDVTARVHAIDSLANAIAQLASGDLSTQIDSTFSAEYAGVRTDFNHAIDAMQTAMRQILAVTRKVGDGASEIDQAVDQLSHRTEQQAASLEETAAALDQITATRAQDRRGRQRGAWCRHHGENRRRESRAR